MPQTYNGIGTWYHGKSNVHRVRGVCEFCGSVADLKSYDTTNYFVFLYLPIIPLKKMRILNECSHCQRHLRMTAKEWIDRKTEAFRQLKVQLSEKPDEPQVVVDALETAIGYQDEALFGRLADTIGDDVSEHADVQNALGEGYSYFTNTPQAIQAYEKALMLEDTPERRERLAVSYMKNRESERAEKLLEHISEESKDKLSYLVLLLQSYQAEGKHQDALRVFERLERIEPAVAEDKELIKLRKISRKHAASGKPVRTAILETSKSAGTSKGSGHLMPKLIVPGLILLVLLGYLGTSIYKGLNVPVVLVNGLATPYTVTLNDQEYELPAGQLLEVRVSEGEFQLTTAKNAPIACQETLMISRSFWGRPFRSDTYVLNPDRLGVIEYMRVPYVDASNMNPPNAETRLHTGPVFHEFRDIDFPFRD